LLRQCLRSLIAQSAADNTFETIVVDNGSTDDTANVVHEASSQLRNLRYVPEHVRGLSHARNCGYRQAHGTYVAYLDDDAKASPEWAERIMAVFESVHPTPAVVGGPIFPWYEYPPPRWFKDELEIRSWGKEAGYLEGPSAPNGFSGSNIAFRRELLVTLGGFSTGLGMVGSKIGVGEETQLCRRVFKTAPRFYYDPDLVVYHLVPRYKLKLTYAFRRAEIGRAHV